MKYYPIIGFLLFSSLTNAQVKKGNNIYKTTIDTAGRVEIKGGTTTILKADTVIINQKIRTNIYYLGSTVSRDTTGAYMTSYKFCPEDNAGSFPINITIYLDKPFVPLTKNEPIYADVAGTGGGMTQLMISKTPDYTAFRIRGQVYGDNVVIHVKSKEPLLAAIYGADGRRY